MSNGATLQTPPTLDAAFVAGVLGSALRSRCGPERGFARAVIDSRLVVPGDLFVALPGEHHDGHDFAAEAAASGAAGLLLGRPVGALARTDCARFIVDEPLAALQRLAAAWRAALDATTVVGVTGNVGKTTTKLITAAVLAERYRVRASEHNYNSEVGVPLCLLELTPGRRACVIELGMYTTGEIAALCEWARPRIGVVLNVGPVHLERAGSMDAIIAAKRELVEALPADGHALLNADDPDVRAMASHTAARVWLFGSAADADVRGDALRSTGAAGFEFTLHALGAQRRVHVPLPGAHLLANVLAAAAVGLADGMTLDAVAAALSRLDVPLRLSVRPLPGGVMLLDDTYNANPTSTLAALDLLAELPGRRLALLGDMRELGERSHESHAQVGRRAAGVLDALFTVGELAKGIAEAAQLANLRAVEHIRSKDAAAAALLATLAPGDALLVKGSRALALETVVATLDRSLGEREQAGS